MQCLLCSLMSCYPGFYVYPCTPTNDTQCLPCDNGPVVGPYNWTKGCDFECVDGYYYQNSTCLQCTHRSCAPGFYASNCTNTTDSVCINCDVDVSGPVNFTTGCSFQCADGYYMQDKTCVQCSVPVCLNGFRSTPCTPESDAACETCPSVSGGIWDSGGCNTFTCLAGFYRKSASSCAACSVIQSCPSGAWLSPCGTTTDARCITCEPGEGRVYNGVGCDFTCAEGYYRFNESACAKCNSSISCSPGNFITPCSAAEDAKCSACSSVSGPYTWSNGCSFTCASGYYITPTSCSLCSKPICKPGTLTGGCFGTRDSECVACVQLQGTVWTQGCNYTCAANYYYLGSVCTQCSSQYCGKGFTLSPCTLTKDAVCIACPMYGRAEYVFFDGCNFECAAGFYKLNATTCVPCSSSPCGSGFYRTQCTSAADSTCVECPIPMGAGYVLISDCQFKCNDGYFQYGGMCTRCSSPVCVPGNYVVNCTQYIDAQCAQCKQQVANSVWTQGCNFACKSGYFKSSDTLCSKCATSISCMPGYYATNCTATQDITCAQCSTQSPTGSFWTSGCSYACLPGFYYNAPLCYACTTPKCAPGFFPISCTSVRDSMCVRCTGGNNGTVWLSGCTFACSAGYYRTEFGCMGCTVPVCQPGTFASNCFPDQDAVCLDCTSHLPGPNFHWSVGCESECDNGYYQLNSTTCLPRVPSTTLVNTALVMSNTVPEVCSNLSVILNAISNTMNILISQKGNFTTNITSLNNVTCTNNICPQCTVGRRRFLLFASVGIVTVSQSIVAAIPVNTTLIIQNTLALQLPQQFKLKTSTALAVYTPFVDTRQPVDLTRLWQAVVTVSAVCAVVICFVIFACAYPQKKTTMTLPNDGLTSEFVWIENVKFLKPKNL